MALDLQISILPKLCSLLVTNNWTLIINDIFMTHPELAKLKDLKMVILLNLCPITQKLCSTWLQTLGPWSKNDPSRMAKLQRI